MSNDWAVRLSHVTKNYPGARLASAGLKNLIVHFPGALHDWLHRKPFCAVNDLSVEVRKGECLGIIGRNGSGKSTALALVAGVIRPSSGALETRGRICPLLELGAGFHPELSGRDNILLNGVLLGLTREAVMRKMDEIVAFSELESSLAQPLRVYSSGMMARLGFSIAVHLEPEILLIDEVLAVGDEDFQAKCMRKMAEFRASGVTMIFVSHNLNAIEEICDSVLLLDKGSTLRHGAPGEVIETYLEVLDESSHAVHHHAPASRGRPGHARPVS